MYQFFQELRMAFSQIITSLNGSNACSIVKQLFIACPPPEAPDLCASLTFSMLKHKQTSVKSSV
jgi:hypothetical protein